MQLIEVHEGTLGMHHVFIEGGSISTGIMELDVSPVYILLDHWNPLWRFVSTEVNLDTISVRRVDMVWEVIGDGNNDYLSFPNTDVPAGRLERFPSKQRTSDLFWTDYLGFNNKEL